MSKSAKSAALEEWRAARPDFKRPPRAGSAGKPISFKASDEERLAYEDQALADGFLKKDGSVDLSALIRDCLAERLQYGRRKR